MNRANNENVYYGSWSNPAINFASTDSNQRRLRQLKLAAPLLSGFTASA
jgi:hypothetical protein